MRICARCGTNRALHEHHIIPRALDGTDEDGRVLLCKKCHMELHCKLMGSLYKFVADEDRYAWRHHIRGFTRWFLGTEKQE